MDGRTDGWADEGTAAVSSVAPRGAIRSGCMEGRQQNTESGDGREEERREEKM